MKAFLVSVFLVLALAGTVRAQGQVEYMQVFVSQANPNYLLLSYPNGQTETIELLRSGLELTAAKVAPQEVIITQKLNSLAQQGWRIIGITSPSTGSNFNLLTRYTLERPRP